MWSCSKLLIVFIIHYHFMKEAQPVHCKKYKGDKVVTVKLSNHSDHDHLAKFVNSHKENEINVWAESTDDCQLQVSKATYREFKQYCHSANISMNILINDVKVAIEKQYRDNVKEIKAWKRRNTGFDFDAYNRFCDIKQELYRIRNQYPHLVDLRDDAGKSFWGRPLMLLRITENIGTTRAFDFKPIIWVDAGIHAREWISIAVAMKFIKRVVEQYGKNDTVTQLLRYNTLYVVPVFNPDGYEYSWKCDRLWRKTRTRNSGLKCVGADGNRNWDILWAGAGSSNDSCSDVFHGISPESEPCVRAFAELLRMKKHQLKAYFNLHSFGQLLFIPNSYTTTLPSDFEQIRPVALAFQAAATATFNNRYTALSQAFLAPITGAAIDYVHDKLNVTHSYLVELRPATEQAGGFLLPPNQIEPTFQEFFNGFIASIKEIDRQNSTKKIDFCKNREHFREILQYLLTLVR